MSQVDVVFHSVTKVEVPPNADGYQIAGNLLEKTIVDTLSKTNVRKLQVKMRVTKSSDEDYVTVVITLRDPTIINATPQTIVWVFAGLSLITYIGQFFFN